MFELKVQVTDRLKAVSFLKTLSFVSSEYVLLETDGTLTVRLEDVPLSSYNTADLLDCGTIDRFLFDGKEFQKKKDVARVIKIEAKADTTAEKQDKKPEPHGTLKETWPAIDLIIKNSTDIGSLASQLYKYLGLSAKNATKFEALVATYLQHTDMKISWARLQEMVPEFTQSCLITFRKKASDKGYKALELVEYILTNDDVRSMSTGKEEEPEECHEEDDKQEEPQEHTTKVVLNGMLKGMPILHEPENEQVVRDFENFLINCDKTKPLSTLLRDMLKLVTPDKSYDDVVINYAVDALTSMDTEAYVKDESAFTFDKKRARAMWSTIATEVANMYDRSNHAVITATTFLEAIKPYLKQ